MRRLSRIFSKSSVKSIDGADLKRTTTITRRCPLFDLPIEILLVIESYLFYENAISLSLTCKQAYSLFFHRNKPLRRRHNRDKHFLFLLERDYPRLLTCPVHEFLYDWQKQRGKRYRCPRKCGVGDSMVVCNRGCRVGFHGIFDAERRLMIRHSFLGPEYGISMKSLNHVCKRGRSQVANEVTPRRAGNSLMIWRTSHFSTRIDFDSWKDLELERGFDELVCVHSTRYLLALVAASIHKARRRRKWLIKASTSQRNYLNHLTSWQCLLLFKCAQCATDIRLNIDQLSPNQIDVQFDIFQDLGGLNQMDLARYQVLGTRFGITSQNLGRRDKRERLRDNLERRYFGESEVAERCCDGIPWHTAFLGQWWYNSTHDEEHPVYFRPDGDIPRPIWLSYCNKIPFSQSRDIRLCKG